jgi:hypothetical protein
MWIYILLALLLLLVLIGVLGFKFWRDVSKIDLNFSIPDLPDVPPERWDRPFTQTGDEDLPYSIRLRGKGYRWQQQERVQRGAEFYKMFEDGPWKWKAQGRFAGAGLNCGHYLV